MSEFSREVAQPAKLVFGPCAKCKAPMRLGLIQPLESSTRKTPVRVSGLRILGKQDGEVPLACLRWQSHTLGPANSSRSARSHAIVSVPLDKNIRRVTGDGSNAWVINCRRH